MLQWPGVGLRSLGGSKWKTEFENAQGGCRREGPGLDPTEVGREGEESPFRGANGDGFGAAIGGAPCRPGTHQASCQLTSAAFRRPGPSAPAMTCHLPQHWGARESRVGATFQCSGLEFEVIDQSPQTNARAFGQVVYSTKMRSVSARSLSSSSTSTGNRLDMR